MIYTLVSEKRMEYVNQSLQGEVLDKTAQLKEGDILIFPLHWKEACLEKAIQYEKFCNLKIFLPYFDETLNRNNKIYAYMEDEKLLCENATLTAMGIMQFFENMNYSLFTKRVDIIGKGRCAKAFANLLEECNVPYRFVYYKLHEKCVLSDLYYKKGDCIVNTADTCILKNGDAFLEDVEYILDISSTRCIQKLKNHKHKVLFPGSLPNAYFPFFSSMLIVNYIRRVLHEK